MKMVHNGIEYGDMQLISEAYLLMRDELKMSNDQMSDVFAAWNKSELDSYLIEITADILRKRDEKSPDRHTIDMILDASGQKGARRRGRACVRLSLMFLMQVLASGPPRPGLTMAFR